MSDAEYEERRDEIREAQDAGRIGTLREETSGKATFTPSQIEAMSDAEYEEHRQDIKQAVARDEVHG